MTPYHHAVSSTKKWGGQPEDYLPVHDWFDASKGHYADQRHRALRHHSAGIFECEAHFGNVITNSDGKAVPVRLIGEQHVKEDCGFIPTVKDWLQNIQLQPWMQKVAVKSTDVEKMPDYSSGVIPTEPTAAITTLDHDTDRANWPTHCPPSADNLS